MSRHCYIDMKTGEIKSLFSFSHDVEIPTTNEVGERLVSGVSDGVSLNHFYDAETSLFIEKGDRPSAHHAWDVGARAWMIDLPAAWQAVRAQRDRLLAQSDWTDTVSAKERMIPSVFEDWARYRQALRDVTNQADPLNIIWPVKPY